MSKHNTIAIDLAKNVFQVCICTPDMKVKSNKKVTRADLVPLITQQEPSLIAMEACYSSHYWARTFEAMGHQVKLIPAQHVKPFVRGNKNDKNDALAIAEASARPALKSVPIKSIGQQDIQCLHRIRERLIRNRTALANQTRGLLSEYGVIFPQGYKALVRELTDIVSKEECTLSPIMKKQCHAFIEEFHEVTLRIHKIEEELMQYAKQNEDCQRLLSLPGIGVINATALYSAIGNASQFANPRELAVWLGLTPQQYASGDKKQMGGITKRGNRYLRKQLIHGARASIYRSKNKDDKLSQWVNELIERRGICKASVAYAARLARLAWLLLQRKEHYQAHNVSA